MKFKKKKTPAIGDRKCVVKFAFLPIETETHYVWFGLYNSYYVWDEYTVTEWDPVFGPEEHKSVGWVHVYDEC